MLALRGLQQHRHLLQYGGMSWSEPSEEVGSVVAGALQSFVWNTKIYVEV